MSTIKVDEILDFFHSDKTFLILVGKGGTGKTRALLEAVDLYRIQMDEKEEDLDDNPSTIVVSHNHGETLHPIYNQKSGPPNAKIVFVRLEPEENLISPVLASEFGLEIIEF